MTRTRRKACTSLLRRASCPRARRTGSMNHHNAQTGARSTHRCTRQRWKCTPLQVRRVSRVTEIKHSVLRPHRSEGLPPVNACDPRVSSAVVPPSATMKPVVA
jgi:hypothetical protein